MRKKLTKRQKQLLRRAWGYTSLAKKSKSKKKKEHYKKIANKNFRHYFKLRGK